MIKAFCFLFITFLSCHVFGQDSTKHLFKPGTLVGKYYGTYDTTAKKNAEVLNTKKAANLDQMAGPQQQSVTNTTVSQRPEIQVNQNFNPIEVSGTEKVSQIIPADAAAQRTPGDQTVSQRPALEVNQNFDPIEVSGTTEAGRIATPANDSPGNLKAQTITTQTPLKRTVQPVIDNTPTGTSERYRGTRLGSSSPLYNTYRTNDDGAGAVTTAPKNGSAPLSAGPVEGAVQEVPQPAQKSFYRDTRLGSSAPMYNTYRSNNNGAGSVTTNPNKAGGGAVFSGVADILPEQAPADSTTIKTDIRSMQKRADENGK